MAAFKDSALSMSLLLLGAKLGIVTLFEISFPSFKLKYFLKRKLL